MDTGYPALITEPASQNDPKTQKQQNSVTTLESQADQNTSETPGGISTTAPIV